MTESEELGHNEVAEHIAGAARWAASQPWALTPGQVRGQPHSVTSQRRWRPPSLRVGVVSFAAAALVVVAVSVVLVTASSSLSSAQIRQKIAEASALSSKAGTIRIDEVITQKGVPAEHLSRLVLPASGVSRLFYFRYFDAAISFYITEVDNASTGYVRMTSSPTVPVAEHGWVSYPLDRVTDPAQVPPGSPGGVGGVVGRVTSLGTKEIGSVKATGYGVTVSAQALIAEAKTEAARGNYRSAYLDNGITRFPAQIWLDASDHVRELHWTVHPVTKPTETSTEVFSYSTAVVTINFPPSIDVTPAADRTTAYLLALDNAAETGH
jgi:hypothetical protein